MLTQKQHPNLVAVREIPAALVTVLNSPEPCLGMELCEGGDLRKVQAVSVKRFVLSLKLCIFKKKMI